MFVGSIQEFARDVVASQPVPPRQVGLRSLVSRAYASHSGRIVAGTGVVLGIPLIVISIFGGSNWDAWRVSLLAFAVLFTIAITAAPGLYAWRMWRALRDGTVARAEVIRVAFSGPSLRPDTIDAQRHGMARGTWRVDGPRGPFEIAFECDAAWASHLRRGTQVQVIVDAARPRVLLDLGPVAETVT